MRQNGSCSTAILIYRPPEIMLLTVYFYEGFIEEKGIAIAPVFSFQSACINGTELDAPEADRFTADSDTAFG